MAFAVVCKSCQARFLLNDDLLRRKVAGRVVTVRCRQCHATIEVDASEVDPKTLPETEKPLPKAPSPKGAKPAPAPPRPVAKSTLMGIGGPPRPAGATELVALSPGFLNVTPGAPAASTNLRGFPEPPPPPGPVEELGSADWEVSEPPPAREDAVPESVDDFAEELPPSLPPEEAPPSSSGVPSLEALTHHDPHASSTQAHDFLANITAAMNGGIMTATGGGAPTIDVSTLATPAEASANPPSIDVSGFDAPRTGKQTLPLFALTDDATAPAPPEGPKAPPTDGSLSPSALDRPQESADPSDRLRERRNVIAPATKSLPPAAVSPRRSGLAAPILIALAMAAGFLIWRRSTQHADQPAQVTLPTATAPLATNPVAPEPTTAAAAPSIAAATDEDVTFEEASAPTAAPVIHDQAAAAPEVAAPAVDKPAVDKPAVDKPAVEPSTPAEATPAPASPIARSEPTPPAAPAGPFDRAAASAALNASSAQASACRKEGDPSGTASVVITFAPSGRVTSANVSGPPFAGTPTGGCIASTLRRARVPAFEGERVTVSKTIVIQ